MGSALAGTAPARARAVRDASGEPYALAGRRLVFTTWHWVRPGQYRWLDESGANVTVEGPQGPWDANYRLLDGPWGIRLRAQPAQRVGPILEAEEPWEVAHGIHFSTLLQEGGRYRAWGSRLSLGVPGTPPVCYFESEDGETWRRPRLDVFEYEGRRGHNVVAAGPFGTVFVDPSAPPDERYKAIGSQFPSLSRAELEAYRARRPTGWEPRAVLEKGVHIVRGGVSPDGLEWTALREPLVVEHSDTQIVARFDAGRGTYVAYTRTWAVGQRADNVPREAPPSWKAAGRRAIGYAETRDFREWPVSQTILEPGPDVAPSDVLYTNCYTTVPGAPDHHLLFPAVWHTATDTTSVRLAASADGRVWHYLPPGPVLETQPFGAWDGGCVFASPNLVELPDGRFALPYTGYDLPHKYPRRALRQSTGYAVWPHGRLVALEAPERGEFSTIGLLPPGRRLRLNVRAQRTGGVEVEVARLNREPIEGRSFAESRPVAGDWSAATAAWTGTDDLGHADGEPVMLRFRLRQAQLFGLEFI